MKKTISIAILIFLCLSLFPQQESQQSFIEQSLVINVEVPVRVFKDNKFIDNLTIEDFEVFEDGIPQKIEAVYLVKKRTIERSDEKKRFNPETSRTFYLFFEISEYSAKMGEAIDYFIQNVLLPGDNLNIVTSIKTYRLKDESLQRISREEIAEQLKGLVRKDTLEGDSEYRNALKELEDQAKILTAKIIQDTSQDSERAMSVLSHLDTATTTGELGDMEIEPILIQYSAYLQKLETLRKVDELRLLDFAKHLRSMEGQKSVFIFYQREYIPQVDQKVLMEASGYYQDVGGVTQLIADIIDFSTRKPYTDVERIKQAYADAATSIHYLFLNRPQQYVPGVYFAEGSNDVFASFVEMARASGGFMDSSANPHFLFQKALNASENYYLLYYAPKEYTHDGRFKNVEVRVKEKDYNVIHRLGYFAN